MNFSICDLKVDFPKYIHILQVTLFCLINFTSLSSSRLTVVSHEAKEEVPHDKRM